VIPGHSRGRHANGGQIQAHARQPSGRAAVPSRRAVHREATLHEPDRGAGGNGGHREDAGLVLRPVQRSDLRADVGAGQRRAEKEAGLLTGVIG
jgi:hypothetical protein